MLTILLQLAGGTAFLYYGADFLVKGGVSIATRFGVSALVIGLTLVAFATSAPELVVSVQAALAGSGDISIGNVIGSNICNIALILGLSAVIAPLSVHRKVLRFDLPVMTAVTLAMAATGLLLGGFTRLTGAVFFAGCWPISPGTSALRSATGAAMRRPKSGRRWRTAGNIRCGSPPPSSSAAVPPSFSAANSSLTAQSGSGAWRIFPKP